MRRTQTKAEAAVWRRLRNRQLEGWKFKRQVPFGQFILDFYCAEGRLAIEVDGGTHDEQSDVAQDEERGDFLQSNGVRVLRFWNSDVMENLEGVLDQIHAVLGREPAPSPGALRRPLPKGRGEVGAN